MEQIGKSTFLQTEIDVVPSGTKTDRVLQSVKLTALSDFFKDEMHCASEPFSPYGQRVILRVLKNCRVDFSSEANRTEGLEIQIDDYCLVIKESSFEGTSRILFEYEHGGHSVLENFTFSDLVIGLEQLIKAHVDKQFSSVSPVRKISYQEAIKAHETLQRSMDGWVKVPEPQTPEEVNESIDQQDWKSPKRTMQNRWNQRISDTNAILNGYRPMLNAVHAIYEVNGIPVGMLIMERSEEQNRIWMLVTHPGFEGAGGSLMEFAINEFDKTIYGPKVYLNSINDDSSRAYEKIGFIHSHREMELNPVIRKDFWCKDENRWRLKKHAEKSYLHEYS